MSTRIKLSTIAAGMILLPLLASCGGAEKTAAGQPETDTQLSTAEAAAHPFGENPDAEGVVFKSTITEEYYDYLGHGMFWANNYGTMDETGETSGWAMFNEHPTLQDLQFKDSNGDIAIFNVVKEKNELADDVRVYAALDVATGDVLWELPPESTVSLVGSVGDLLIGLEDSPEDELEDTLVVLDTKTGEEKWNSNVAAGSIRGEIGPENIVMKDNSILLQGVNGDYRHVNADNGNDLKALPSGFNPDNMQKPDFEDGRYLDEESGAITLFDAQGKQVWQVETRAGIHTFNDLFTVVRVDDNEQFVILNTGNGEILGTVPFETNNWSGCESTAELVDERKLIIDCLDTRSGSEQYYDVVFDLNF